MGKDDDMISAIEELAQEFGCYMDKAYTQYSVWVSAVLMDEITELTQIEKILDGLGALGHDARFRKLYDELCRHVYARYREYMGTQAFASWRMFREDCCGERIV